MLGETWRMGPPLEIHWRGAHGKTLGVIGLGRIGTGVALRSKAFGMRVIAYAPLCAPAAFEQGSTERVTLDRLLAEADVITVQLRSLKTRGISARKNSKPHEDGAIVLNVARGGIYDEAELALL